MILRAYEWEMLKDLIGKKAEALIIPSGYTSVSDPVEVILVMADQKNLLIDSCSRRQKPTETILRYPQMRIREINQIPHYSQGERIRLNTEGEIIRSVEVVNELYASPQDFVDYTKSIHIKFSGDREFIIERDSFRTPNLHIYEEADWKPGAGGLAAYTTRQVLTL